MLAKAWSFADKLADACDDSWLRLGLHRRQRHRFQGHLRGARGLYIGAFRCGMEPGPYFEEAAEISSGDSNMELTPMRDFLLRFEGSAYFGESVAANLG
jgi:hypothetical protein